MISLVNGPRGVAVDITDYDDMCRRIAARQQREALKFGFTARGEGSYDTSLLGARGETALFLYLGVIPSKENRSYWQEQEDGYDVLGYQVRTRGKRDYDLAVHVPGDCAGRRPDNLEQIFIYIDGSKAPNMKIVGWCVPSAVIGRKGVKRIAWKNDVFYVIPRKYLNPMSSLPVTAELSAERQSTSAFLPRTQ